MAGHSAQWQHCCVIDMIPGLSALFHLDTADDETKPVDRTDGSFQDWLKNVHLSVSTDGLLLSIANATQTVFMTASDSDRDENGGLSKYSLTWQGSLEDAENDRISAVLSLTISPPKSATSWHVVVVGFASGYLRIYLPKGELLLSQWLHRDQVHSIRCQAGGVHVQNAIQQGEELLVTYGNVIVAVDGYSLLNCLRACLHKTEGSEDMPSLSYKKYSFSGITQINDLASVGLQSRTPLSQLREASFNETPVSHVHHETVAHYVVSSPSPPFAAYHASETMSTPLLSIVASAVAQKLRTAVASQLSWAKSWLGMNTPTSPAEDRAGLERSTSVPYWRNILDQGREGRSVVLSPCGRWMATTDSLGRILQVDTRTMLVLRVWKGYRDTQCGWVVEMEDAASSASEEAEAPTGRSAMFLVFYAPRRGIVELWPSDGGARIGAYSVGKQCCLLYNPSSVLGQSRQLEPFPVLYQCALLHPSGNVWALRVPFTAALSQNQQQMLADQRAVNKLRSEDDPMLSPEELERLLLSISDQALAKQALSLAIRLQFPANVLLDKCKLLREKWIGPEEDDVRRLSMHYMRLLQLLVHVGRNADSDTLEEKELHEVLEESGLKTHLPFVQIARVLESCNELKTLDADNGVVERGNQLSAVEFIDSFVLASSGDLSILELKSNLSDFHLQCVGVTLCQPVLTGDITCADFLAWCQQSGLLAPTIMMLVLHAFTAMPVFSSTGITVVKLKDTLELLVKDSADSVWPAGHAALLQSQWPAPAWLAALLLEKMHNSARHANGDSDDDDGGGGTDDRAAASSEESSWQEIHAACEEWTMLRVQLWDLVCLSSVTKLGVSVDSMLASDSSLVTLLTARWVVHRRLAPVALYPEDVCGAGAADSSLPAAWQDGDLPSFATLLETFPTNLQHDLFLAECCYAACTAWKEGGENADILGLSVQYYTAINSAAVQQALGMLVWHTYFRDYVTLLVTLVDKVGRVAKDSLCQRHVGLTWVASIQMLCCAAKYLTILEQVLGDTESKLPVFECDGHWIVNRMTWPDDYLVAKLECQRPANRFLVILQKQLVCILHARMDLRGTFKPSAMVSTKARQFLSQPLYHAGGHPSLLEVSPELEEVREKGLCQLVAMAAREGEWPARLLRLCGILQVRDDGVRRALVLDMFAVADAALHTLAAEMVAAVVDKHQLGSDLLQLSAQRICEHFRDHFTAHQQVEVLAGLTPSVTSWLKPKYKAPPKERRPNAQSRSAIASTIRLLELVCGLLDEGNQLQTASMLLDTLTGIPSR